MPPIQTLILATALPYLVLGVAWLWAKWQLDV